MCVRPCACEDVCVLVLCVHVSACVRPCACAGVCVRVLCVHVSACVRPCACADVCVRVLCVHMHAIQDPVWVVEEPNIDFEPHCLEKDVKVCKRKADRNIETLFPYPVRWINPALIINTDETTLVLCKNKSGPPKWVVVSKQFREAKRKRFTQYSLEPDPSQVSCAHDLLAQQLMHTRHTHAGYLPNETDHVVQCRWRGSSAVLRG